MSSPPNDHLANDPRISDAMSTGQFLLDRRPVADGAYLVLVTSGWMFFNMLGALGCAVAFFIVLSAGQWDAFFLQLDNLTSRYVAADVSRRWMFEHYLVQGFMILFATITVLRAPGFIRRVRAELAKAPRA